VASKIINGFFAKKEAVVREQKNDKIDNLKKQIEDMRREMSEIKRMGLRNQ
jgi:predicted transcriptional regulator